MATDLSQAQRAIGEIENKIMLVKGAMSRGAAVYGALRSIRDTCNTALGERNASFGVSRRILGQYQILMGRYVEEGGNDPEIIKKATEIINKAKEAGLL